MKGNWFIVFVVSFAFGVLARSFADIGFTIALTLLLIAATMSAADFSSTKPEKIGVNYGGSSSEDFEICHSDNKELFVRAAKIIGDPIVGFDFIIPDIAKSWKEQECGFIEANSLPFVNLHHNPLLGQPRNVAAKVWELIGF